MARQKRRIKKIDNVTARQVTFCKRRRGIFKKAQELSVLCDAKVALLVFSATGKFYEYASSSMKDILTRYNQHFHDINQRQGPLEMQLEDNTYNELRKKVAEKTQQLRRMKGEDFEGLNLDDVQHMEERLEEGLKRVIMAKEKLIADEIVALQKKLEDERKQLKQKMIMISKGKTPSMVDSNIAIQETFSSDSMNNVCSCNSGPSIEDDSSDTSLKLGLPFPD
ncbi:PREDICTED: MADS-box protein AGL24-like isoform X2 [Lupinus angustifolius]|uniref:MADS-box protein AGL24-like isoform X2 n=1 Tax=Lupinus angustifolius TaxID=3871 RepID=UPI00092E58E5|nr:PREDICTED: MADS-box protein AGL24-like isoform X2 [Lupinus angustifolius]